MKIWLGKSRFEMSFGTGGGIECVEMIINYWIQLKYSYERLNFNTTTKLTIRQKSIRPENIQIEHILNHFYIQNSGKYPSFGDVALISEICHQFEISFSIIAINQKMLAQIVISCH